MEMEVVNMAVEKSLMTTEGWTLSNAYYKIHDVSHLTDNTHQANIWVYMSQNERQVNPDTPIKRNLMSFEVDPSAYIEGVSDEENKIKQAYGKLKNLTDSFQNDSNDV